jgi:hypothetical protein
MFHIAVRGLIEDKVWDHLERSCTPFSMADVRFFTYQISRSVHFLHASQPPSTLSEVPVVNFAVSEQR